MESTIAAISTAYGESAIGIVRMSGPLAEKIASEIFVPASGCEGFEFKPRYMHYGFIQDKSGKKLDEVLCVYMKAPHTYTGEDLVEIQCHSSVVSLKAILDLCLECGAVPAEKGEFTRRAFLNGRLDLAQAEAVIDLIRARSNKGFDLAMGQMEGKLSGKLKELRSELLDLLVELTVNMDYPDEDIEVLTYDRFKNSLSAINDKILKLTASYDEGRILKEGLSVAIVGKPNVGKSSLMNAFLKEERSIVTSVPGTTRDTVEEQLHLNGLTLRFIDTAGIHESSDIVESIGIEKSKAAFNRADILLLLLDASSPLEKEDMDLIDLSSDRKLIAVLNKQDLAEGRDCADKTRAVLEEKLPGVPIVMTSMLSGEGFDSLTDAVESLIFSGSVNREDDILLADARHKSLLDRAAAEIDQAISELESMQAMDFVEINVRAAYDLIGEITGDTASDSVINEVFSRFCLGK